ncbi:MAG: hypothetical protein ATN35_13385 [Epulopiscium sp. Nele67-Bin004]|nr:MAG: hypothetical protein ATN35_13385 [Epulopiscium sp. Nele67-Bin004]
MCVNTGGQPPIGGVTQYEEEPQFNSILYCHCQKTTRLNTQASSKLAKQGNCINSLNGGSRRRGEGGSGSYEPVYQHNTSSYAANLV